ncbi:MAG: Hpt domain-containing protein [Lachnoclostridium sp.]|jgi:HPt (histidine-containing phosphotransfer) domain-containing protein|nr:Hpt domain-containing protein [Lachnoclostridium sp.]
MNDSVRESRKERRNMQAEFKQKLLDNGFEMEKTLTRFMGKEDMYEKFLKRFLDDHNMEKLESAYKQENMEDAFFAAHTLKGVIANLGMDALLKPLTPFVEKLRAGDNDEEAKEYFVRVKAEYENIISILKEHVG